MEKPSSHSHPIDLLRVIAGLAVVAIHVSDRFMSYPPLFGGITWWIADIVNSVSRIAVPLFIMISGYLLLKKHAPSSSFLKRRFKRVGIPLLFWGILFFIWKIVWLPWTQAKVTPLFVVNSLFSGSMGGLYFLYIILGLYLVTPFLWILLQHTTDRQKRYLLLLSFIFSLGTVALNHLLPDISVKSNTFTMFVPYISFYLAGDYFGDRKLTLLQQKVALGVFTLSTVITAIGAYILSYYKISQYFHEHFTPFIIAMTLSLFLLTMNYADKIPAVLNTITKHIAPTIFGIYLIHPYIIDFVDEYTRLRVDKILSPLWFFMILKIMIVFGASYAIIWLARKNKILRIIVG